MKILAFLLALSFPALARIGETYEQCVARYGAATSPPTKGSARFVKGGIIIMIDFSGGIAQEIRFAGQSDPGSFSGKKLTDAQVQSILDANAAGSPWKDITPNGGGLVGKELQREDGSAHAMWNYMSGTLMIESKASFDAKTAAAKASSDADAAKKAAEEKRKRDAERKSTEGF
jgi:hypothetical protein